MGCHGSGQRQGDIDGHFRDPLLGSPAMAARRSMWWPLLAAAAQIPPSAAAIHEVIADPAEDLSVTVYRAPARGEGAFDLDDLEGFALIRETRTVRIPAGESRIRFEGVADGIEPVSAIITGLPTGIV